MCYCVFSDCKHRVKKIFMSSRVMGGIVTLNITYQVDPAIGGQESWLRVVLRSNCRYVSKAEAGGGWIAHIVWMVSCSPAHTLWRASCTQIRTHIIHSPSPPTCRQTTITVWAIPSKRWLPFMYVYMHMCQCKDICICWFCFSVRSECTKPDDFRKLNKTHSKIKPGGFWTSSMVQVNTNLKQERNPVAY